MLIKWALVCAILMEEDRIQENVYIYAKQKKICMLTKYTKQKKGKINKTDYNKQKGLKAYKSKLKQNKTA